MAIYHLHVRFVKRSEGRSSVAAAAYRAGEKLYDERQEKGFDFRHKTHVEHAKILLSDEAPEHLRDRPTYWNAVERSHVRKDAQVAFEVEMALPRELSHEDRVSLAETYAQREFVSQGLQVDVCIHVTKASDGGEHPHVHMLIGTRRLKEDGTFGNIARDMQDNPKLIQRIQALEKAGKLDEALLLSKGTHLADWRENWATLCNEFLDEAGEAARIDHRTLAAQQIEREAMPHIGVAFHSEREGLRGWLANRVEAFKEFKWPENWRDTMREQFERIRQKAPDLQADFFAHAREFAPELYPELRQQTPDRGIEHER